MGNTLKKISIVKRSTLSAIIFISAVTTLISYYLGQQMLIYIMKPLTTLLIIILAFQGIPKSPKPYGTLITTGLFFCLAGDIFLMLPADLFLQGLSSFFIAHLLFISAFISTEKKLKWYLPIVFYSTGFIIFKLLSPNLGNLFWPVFFYLLVIVTMSWRAVESSIHSSSRYALAAAIGSVLFLISDTLLAINKFHTDIGHSHTLILSTYYLAISFIALSTPRSSFNSNQSFTVRKDL